MIDSGDKTRRKKTYNLTKSMRKTWENKIQSLWLWVEYMSTKEIKGRNGNLRSFKKMQGTWWEAEGALAKNDCPYVLICQFTMTLCHLFHTPLFYEKCLLDVYFIIHSHYMINVICHKYIWLIDVNL
jgi:hypothetical protein